MYCRSGLYCLDRNLTYLLISRNEVLTFHGFKAQEMNDTFWVWPNSQKTLFGSIQRLPNYQKLVMVIKSHSRHSKTKQKEELTLASIWTPRILACNKKCCKMHFWSLQICMDNTKSKKLPNSIFLIPFSQVFNKTSKHEFDLLRHKNTIQRYHVLLQKMITQSILQSSNSNFTMT